MKQYDLIHLDLNLKTRKTIKLVLFDIRLLHSLHLSEKAAIEFLKRLKTVKKFWISRAAEDIKLKLQTCDYPRLLFGMDIKQLNIFQVLLPLVK